jgi:phosphoglycolate phosphatase
MARCLTPRRSSCAASRRAVRRCGRHGARMRRRRHVIGLGLMQALAHAAPDVPKEKYPELGRATGTTTWQHQDDLSLFDGVLPMLAALKQRQHWLAVATGKSRHGLDDAACMRLNSRAVRRLPHRRRDRRQAHPAHAAGADGRVRRGAAHGLMVGDTTHDLQMALNAGCASVASATAPTSRRLFDALGPRSCGALGGRAAWLAVVSNA